MKSKVVLLLVISMIALNITPYQTHAITTEYKDLNIPFICQTEDLPANTMGLGDPENGYKQYGNYACGPTSTTMVLAYYNLLPPPKSDYIKMVDSSFPSYGYYVAPDMPFTTSAMTYDKRNRFIYSSPNVKKEVWGVWGETQVDAQEPNGTQSYRADIERIKQLLQRNGLSCEQVYNNNIETDSFKKTVKDAIDNNYAIIWHVTGNQNHYLVCRGYHESNSQFFYIINDPFPRNGQRQDGVQRLFSEIPHSGQSNDYIMIVKGQNPGAVFDCGNLNISPSSVQAESNKYTSIDFTTNYNIDSIYGTFIDPQGNPFVSVPLSLVSDKIWKVNFTFDKNGIWKIELNITKDGGICKKVITVEVKNPNDCTSCTLDILSQCENDCTTLIPPGGMITLKSVCLRGAVKKCPDNFQVQFEVTQVSDIFFQNAYSKLGTTLSQEVSVNFSNLANGQYHWRARVLKPDGTPCSAWFHYGNNVNGAPDFIIGDSPCNMDTSNIPSQIACINIGDYSVDINGYNPQNCTITVTSDRTDVIIVRNSTKQNSFGRFFVYIESVNVCGTANITISVAGCVNCTKTVAISVIGQCCGQSSELFVDPQNATMCVGEKRQFYIKSTTGVSFTDEQWRTNSPCLREVQGKPGMFEAVCAGGPF